MSDSNNYINPDFKKGHSPKYDLQACISGVENKDYKILSHLISKSESHVQGDRAFVSNVLSALPNHHISKRIAVSGSPGVGKSTFINAFGKILIDKGNNIAVLPVDPSSQISKGSILGDKTRMSDIGHLESAFIKPMSSSLSVGGVAPATAYASMICEKAGFDYIFIETVGVGQSEYLVKDMVDCFILLLQPGGGDDLQGIKRGIMEMADIMIINKADGPHSQNAKMSLDAYKNALKLLLPNQMGWKSTIGIFSSLTLDGASDITALVDEYFKFLSQDNRIPKLRNQQAISLFERQSREIVLAHFNSMQGISELMEELKKSIYTGTISTIEALHKLEGIFNEA